MQQPSPALRPPHQTSLLPPSPREWPADDHQVYCLLDLADELHPSGILVPAQVKDPRAEKGFDPRMLLLLYACCVGIASSRRIERACYEDLAFRLLPANQQPDHSCISEFRRRNPDALNDLFVQILRLCQTGGDGEPGPCGTRCHQGAGQSLHTQGHEQRADSQSRDGASPTGRRRLPAP